MTINPYEVLGRSRIQINPNEEYLRDARVLVTGAGGSIGTVLCQRLALCGVSALVMLDRDESALHAAELSIRGRALLNDDMTVLGDIRDMEWMRRIFASIRPDIVFHAAALKHQPLLERYPSEAIKTNIIGTSNVLRVSARVGAKLVVNVSTDKAADPTCVLGASKRIAECLTAWYQPERYISVRFGNVFGSRGSVVETFLWQIRERAWVTVTSPLMSRYFITSDEAIDLLIHAGLIGQTGEVLIMDMGKPVQIAALAERLGEYMNIPTKIAYTGGRLAEKETETLLGSGEVDWRPSHPMIRHVPAPPLSCPEIVDMGIDDPCLAKKQLFDIVEGMEWQ